MLLYCGGRKRAGSGITLSLLWGEVGTDLCPSALCYPVINRLMETTSHRHTHTYTHFERTSENQQLLSKGGHILNNSSVTHFAVLLNRSPSYKHIIYTLFTIYCHKTELPANLFSDSILVWGQHLHLTAGYIQIIPSPENGRYWSFLANTNLTWRLKAHSGCDTHEI